MSETTLNHPPQPEVDTTEILFNLVVTLLAPMFFAATGGNLEHARLAAAHTVDSFCPRTHGDLITTALLTGFSFSALGSLSLSMDDGLSIPTILRLRGSAQSASRAAEQHRRALQQPSRAAPLPAPLAAPEPDPGLTAKEVAVMEAVAATRQRVVAAQSQPAQPQAPVRQPAAPSQDPHAQAWASAFMDVAAEIAAELPGLPPHQRRAATIQAEALNGSANALLSGGVEPGNRPYG
jgi:hypothetical protein